MRRSAVCTGKSWCRSIRCWRTAIEAEAAEVVHSQIERITLSPNGAGTREMQLCGDLARIVQFCAVEEGKRERPGRGGPGRGLSVVAGAGFEPATFRL
jgi:site-specific DNA recombinase